MCLNWCYAYNDSDMKENKLIAEFMGVDYVDIDTYLENNKELQYHTSWDWLMPVVETCYDNGADENEIGDITHALLDCDIAHTYKAVVEFIKQWKKIKQ